MTRRRKRRGRRRPLLLYAALLSALCAAVLLRRTDPAPPPPATTMATALPIRAAAIRPRPRTIYPHSLIPGGAWSREDLVAALGRDPIAAAHYRDFDVATARATHLDAARVAWVSYRVDDHIYWTRRPLLLPAGEPVLTDGRNLARARCGNRISFVASSPTGPAVDLDTPELQPDATDDPFGLPLLAYDPFLPDLTLPEHAVSARLQLAPEWLTPLRGYSVLPPLIVGTIADGPPPILPPPAKPPTSGVDSPEPAGALLVLGGILLLCLRGLIRSVRGA